MKKTVASTVFAVLLACASLPAGAQQETEPAAELANIPVDDFDRGTPRRSADGFKAAVDNADYTRAAEYLDLRNLRGEAESLEPEQLARQFAVVLSRATWLDVETLVDDPAGRGDDGLPSYRDLIGIIEDEQAGRDIKLYMQRVPRGDGVFIWKVSNASVSLVPELYAVWGYPAAVEKIRRAIPDVSFLGVELFKFLIAMAVGIAAYLATLLVALVARSSFGDPAAPARSRVFRFLAIPVGLWVFIIAGTETAEFLGRGGTAEAWRRVTPIPVIVTVWVLFVGINLVRDIYITRQQRAGREGASVLARPFANAIKLVVGVAGMLTYLDQLGINITALMAGLGVGGVAVALALQRPMEDVFGAITLYTQQPVRIGDFCRIGSETGSIEEIGLRTTRVRTIQNTLITIPNSRLASEPIDNFSARKKILYRPQLRLRQDTTAEQIETILGNIRALFETHERVLDEGHRVRFKDFANDALIVEAFAYVDTSVWSEYLEVAEQLNLRIMKIVTEAGSGLSLPAQTLRLEQAEAR